uniref:Twin arginine protein translocation system-TatA protein n=1 Tax=Pseudo-nitzschia pungens TaxID=37318 RepID=A0A7T8ILM3_9STRA|nr:twin arginine protein translocation system-TatA protein [Pseudo-nitzschia pungens]QQO80607.1 twin arginine protein translocation system-TatA protein [Pseudo-nitzschia pungens]
MRISIGQILIVLIISFLLFGDVKSLKYKLKNLSKKIETFLKEKNRKKGTWTPDLRFWKPLLYQLNYFPKYFLLTILNRIFIENVSLL